MSTTVINRLRTFGFMLKDVSQRYARRFEEHARTLCLTLVQCRALVILERNEGLSQAALARMVNVQPMRMVRIIDQMQADGLLRRRADPADRRARQVYLTAKAAPVLKQIWRLAEQTRAEVFTGIPQRDRDTFMKILEKMYDNVRTMVPSDEVLTARRGRS